MKLYLKTAKLIQGMITDGNYQIGDKFSSEKKLQKELKVSKTTIREALKIVESKGLIELSSGWDGGIFIKAAFSEKLSDHFEDLLKSNCISFDDLTEFRAKLEGKATLGASQKRTNGDIERLENLIEKAIHFSKNDIPSLIQIDLKFHLEIALINSNPISTQLLYAIHKTDSYVEKFFLIEPDIIIKTIDDLFTILLSLKNRNAKEAKRLAEKHVRDFHRCIGN